MRDQFLTHLGLARRAGCLAVGQDRLLTALAKGTVSLIVTSADIGAAAARQLAARAGRAGIDMIADYDRETLGRAVGLDRCTALGVLDRGFADKLREKRKPVDG